MKNFLRWALLFPARPDAEEDVEATKKAEQATIEARHRQEESFRVFLRFGATSTAVILSVSASLKALVIHDLAGKRLKLIYSASIESIAISHDRALVQLVMKSLNPVDSVRDSLWIRFDSGRQSQQHFVRVMQAELGVELAIQ